MNVECVECGSDLAFNRSPLCSEIIVCSDCGVELEVIGISPITLEIAAEVEEDWGE